MPLGETPDVNEPDAQPRDASTFQREHPERFDWQVDLRDNTYKYERLVEPVGSAEQAGRRHTPFRTTATLNLQSIGLLTRWSDESRGSGGGFYKGSLAPREDTRFRRQADSPIPHNNIWERAAAQYTCDTPSGVYDGGGKRVLETPPEAHYVVQHISAKKHHVVQHIQDTSSGIYDGGGERVPETPPEVNRAELEKRYVIHVDNLKLCTAATQSQDSVATQPSTQ